MAAMAFSSDEFPYDRALADRLALTHARLRQGPAVASARARLVEAADGLLANGTLIRVAAPDTAERAGNPRWVFDHPRFMLVMRHLDAQAVAWLAGKRPGRCGVEPRREGERKTRRAGL
jgi:hypothetical protein